MNGDSADAMARLGIFGGTFDPIHHGHLRLAEDLAEALDLDRVLFVPNHVSPFKTAAQVTPGSVRAEMVALAIADNPRFGLWTGELEREGPSYTVDTLRALSALHPADTLVFLTGADAIRDLAGWREPEAILDLAEVAAGTRPGTDLAEIQSHLPPEWRNRIRFIPVVPLDISATDLRRRVAAGRSIRYLAPPPVLAAIADRHLYRSEERPIGGT
ncbi:MAG: nicotinate-nucleotide adenylyltransferase [Armatimonadota bacterium]